ncbi:hypothetical protein BGW36DRAFT_354762 [Talaromyces proteolyticus]|uniref:Uncharacterized protein n=1 Tax=Talaromyces proteolyticus TaxID=1131652 RepID=A0AAD4Q4K3_9EURO|nr:uncharacterized protein BGW36DRAFT_354762 [Talaromyces proteolyticus]KAH8703341.1 hypothetical protein BGW36DRAFT_354762 [Talaromyces proteolyticus]
MSNIIHDRIESFSKAGGFDMAKPAAEQGWLGAVSDSIVLWALNVNANQKLSPSLNLKKAEGGTKHSLDFDLLNIQKYCPLLQGAFLENLRWESGEMLYRYINEDFTLTESHDAKVFNHDVPQTDILKKGEYIALSHGTHQMDDRYFPNPETFDTRRFCTEEGQNSQKDDQLFEENNGSETDTKDRAKVEYKTMFPWGGGASMC